MPSDSTPSPPLSHYTMCLAWCSCAYLGLTVMIPASASRPQYLAQRSLTACCHWMHTQHTSDPQPWAHHSKHIQLTSSCG